MNSACYHSLSVLAIGVGISVAIFKVMDQRSTRDNSYIVSNMSIAILGGMAAVSSIGMFTQTLLKCKYGV